MPLLAVWGPTGVGKTTVLHELLAAHPEVGLIKTFTSRPARDQVADTKVASTPLPEDTSALVVTPFGGHHYFNVVADLVAAATDRNRLFVVDWVHPPAVDVHGFGPYTASVVLTASSVRTAWRLIRSGRTNRVREALAQARQFRRDVHTLARSDPSLRWQMLSNGARPPADTADALVGLGGATASRET